MVLPCGIMRFLSILTIALSTVSAVPLNRRDDATSTVSMTEPCGQRPGIFGSGTEPQGAQTSDPVSSSSAQATTSETTIAVPSSSAQATTSQTLSAAPTSSTQATTSQQSDPVLTSSEQATTSQTSDAVSTSSTPQAMTSQTSIAVPTSSTEATSSQASAPVLTDSTAAATTSHKLQTSSTKSAVSSSFAALSSGIDPFSPIATNAPPSQIPQTGGHPQPTNNIVPQDAPLHTNKFYANMFLGSEMSGIFTTPYVLAWSNGSGQTSSCGMAVSHTEAYQRAFGDPNPNIPGSPAAYFINPLGIQSIVMSANELGQGSKLWATDLDTFSANAVLQPAYGGSSNITFPLVQGMGLVSGKYTNLQPQLQSGVFFTQVTSTGAVAQGIYKWQISLNDGKSWLLYVTPDSDTGSAPTFSLTSNSLIQGPANFTGLIQIAKNPASNVGENAYDSCAGTYAISGKLSGVVNGTVGSYSLTWAVGGRQNASSLVHYALPHLVDSFDSQTSGNLVNGMQLQTTVKGNASAVLGNVWTMTETALPADMGFAPWTGSSNSSVNSRAALTSNAIGQIKEAATTELKQDMVAQSNLNSMYYSGKALSKFASIIYATNSLAGEPALAQSGLATLKEAFNIFTNNTQDFPLFYDTVWKGIVSSASYNGGDAGADFGNTFYNDHHFHYGYFLHAAAIVGSLDSDWLAANKDWVNALARDVSNPSSVDTYFPVFRSFDWFNGHSMAKGLYESGDGKDEESSSEDVMFSYGLKMWGKVTGDASMEARGNLMLAVQARSLAAYFLMESNNTNQPANFIGNKVTGIMFENKIDHVTYFGANPEYVQGIHMIPLTAASVLTRRENFVKEEWQTYFAEGAVADARNVTGGWKGILYANLALIDPASAYEFFSDPDFDDGWLDGGASRTWYLALAAGLGGA